MGPHARPVCHQRWVSVTASSTPRSEAQRRAQHQPVVGFAGVTCLPGRLEPEHGVRAELLAGPGAHRAGPGIPERHARVGREHAAVAGEAEAVAHVHLEPALRLEFGVAPQCVAQSRSDLDPRARLGVAPVVAHSELRARGEVAPEATSKLRSPSTMRRRRVTSPSVATMSFVRALRIGE